MIDILLDIFHLFITCLKPELKPLKSIDEIPKGIVRKDEV